MTSFLKKLNWLITVIAEISPYIVNNLAFVLAILIIFASTVFCGIAYFNFNKMLDFLYNNLQTFIPVFKLYCPLANTPHSSEQFAMLNNKDSDNNNEENSDSDSDNESESNDYKNNSKLVENFIEHFDGDDINQDDDKDEKLKYIANNCPPTQVFNDIIGDYQDLVLADF